MNRLNSNHLLLLSIVALAGVYLWLQDQPVTANTTTHTQPSAYAAPTAMSYAASSVAGSATGLDDMLSKLRDEVLSESGDSALAPVSPAVVGGARQESGYGVAHKVFISGQQSFEINAWKSADGWMVGDNEHAINCTWVGDGWSFTGPDHLRPYVTQNAHLIGELRNMCAMNGAYGSYKG